VSSNLHSPFPFSSLFSSGYVKLLNIIIGIWVCPVRTLFPSWACYIVMQTSEQTGLGFFFLKKKKIVVCGCGLAVSSCIVVLV
jgi:hypothetical protein